MSDLQAGELRVRDLQQARDFPVRDLYVRDFFLEFSILQYFISRKQYIFRNGIDQRSFGVIRILWCLLLVSFDGRGARKMV